MSGYSKVKGVGSPVFGCVGLKQSGHVAAVKVIYYEVVCLSKSLLWLNVD